MLPSTHGYVHRRRIRTPHIAFHLFGNYRYRRHSSRNPHRQPLALSTRKRMPTSLSLYASLHMLSRRSGPAPIDIARALGDDC